MPGQQRPRPPGLVEKYRAEDAAPLVDRERIAALGLEERPVVSQAGNFAHDPDLLAQAVLEIYRSRVHARLSGASGAIFWRSDHVLFSRSKGRAVPRPAEPAVLRPYGVLLYCNTFSAARCAS